MTNSEQIFLVLCRDLNFHRAAEHCYVTQQCLSDHIRRLEEKYGTPLFLRRPKVALTLAGEALRRTLEKSQILEHDLSRELEQLINGQSGRVSLGINASRAHIMLPAILQQYRTVSPEAELSIQIADTRKMEQELEDGKLDCFIGVNAAGSPSQVRLPLVHDSIYLVVSQILLEKTGISLSKNGIPITLQQVSTLPFVRNLPGSTLNEKVDQLLAQNGLALKQIAAVSDYKIQLEICQRGWGAMFCPEMLLELPGMQQEDLIQIPVAGLENALQVDLVYHREHFHPACVLNLFACIQTQPWRREKTSAPLSFV